MSGRRAVLSVAEATKAGSGVANEDQTGGACTVAVGTPDLRAHAAALDRLFLQMQAELHSYFGRRLGNPDLAAEHTQDTFLRFARMGYRADGAEARAIIFGIARNLFADYLRKLRRQRELGFDETHRAEAAVLENVASREASPEQALSDRRDLETVLAAIRTLPPKCRRVFVMHRLHGRSHKEIAAELGITRSMVEKHIIEATARLMKSVRPPS